MPSEAARGSVVERTAKIRHAVSATSEAELVTRRLDTVDLIVNGATLRQVATHFGSAVETVRDDYRHGLAMLVDASIEQSIELRDEITLRQRALILANMPKAKLGDRSAAQIVNNADNLLASIWGLRSLRVDMKKRSPNPDLATALEGYLAGLAEGGT